MNILNALKKEHAQLAKKLERMAAAIAALGGKQVKKKGRRRSAAARKRYRRRRRRTGERRGQELKAGTVNGFAQRTSRSRSWRS